MKKFIIVLSVFLAGNSMLFAQQLSKKNTEKVVYACPMHTNQKSNMASKCEICGMDKVKLVNLKNMPVANTIYKPMSYVYVCKMDDEAADKSGKCPICGMEMAQMEIKKRK